MNIFIFLYLKIMALTTQNLAQLEAIKKAWKTDIALQRLQENLKSWKINQEQYDSSTSYLKPVVTTTPKVVTTTATTTTTPKPVVTTTPKQAFVGEDIAKKIWLTQADSDSYKTFGKYEPEAQAKIDTYKVERAKTTTPKITSLSQTWWDLNKLWDLIKNRYTNTKDIKVEWNTVTWIVDWEKYSWNYNEKWEPVKTKLAKVEISNAVKEKDTTPTLWTDLLSKDKKEIATTKMDTLKTQKTKDEENTWNNFIKSSDVINSNNKLLLNLYWLDDKWNIDPNNTNWFAYQIEKSRKDFEDLKNTTFKSFASRKYQQTLWTIKSQLASRWVDVTKIPSEQLIALSDRIWSEKFTEVYDAKQKVINDIQTNNQTAIDKINNLREKWLVSTTDAKKNIEALRQTTESQISTINKEYANALFGITDIYQSTAENEKTSTLNTITTLWTQLWLSWTWLSVLNSYVNKYKTPWEAYQAILADLANKNSALYKAVWDVEKARQAQAQFENQLKLLKAEKDKTTSSTAFNATQQVFLRAITWQDLKTVDDLQNILWDLSQEKQDQISNYLQYGTVSDTSSDSTEDQKKK